eukprot:6176529-Pleurochrysis_carterae.AAC.7
MALAYLEYTTMIKQRGMTNVVVRWHVSMKKKPASARDAERQRCNADLTVQMFASFAIYIPPNKWACRYRPVASALRSL